MDRKGEQRSPEEMYAGAKDAFRLHLVESEPSRESIIKGWQLFHRANVARARTRGPKQAEIEERSHVRYVADKLTRKKGDYWSHIDTTTASLGHFVFGLYAYSPIGRDETGSFLDGLDGENLEKAKSFCVEMDSVGWRTGDLDEKYPQE